MGAHYGMAVLSGVALLLATVRCDVSCGGVNGRDGQAGASGRDGRPGPKGEKGEPAVMDRGPLDAAALLRLKGELGSRGPQGPMGPKGFRGIPGPSGDLGSAGPPGPSGRSAAGGSTQPNHSAFSVTRTESRFPPYEQIVKYQSAQVNTRTEFNMNTGQFTCKIPGVYYFTFTSVSKVTMCLRIARDPPFNKLGFCDHNRNADQVLTGGVVLELNRGQKVWLESFKEDGKQSEARDTQQKQISFSGFLLFPN